LKGPNPFALWEDDPAALAGRKHEIRSFASFANAAASRQGSVLVVLGGPGAGKSTILRRLTVSRENEDRGMKTRCRFRRRAASLNRIPGRRGPT